MGWRVQEGGSPLNSPNSDVLIAPYEPQRAMEATRVNTLIQVHEESGP